ncbi:MAG: nucleotidyltransferase domain-containing protein [Anaerolineae bacterium]|nr:nucleotidyltransferase domain-containing protein [Anaerolineae bacterium]
MTTQAASIYIPLIIERLKQIKPAKVILFGSHAQGTASAESDLDLLVVTNDDRLPQNYHEKEQIYLEVARLLRDVRGVIPVDLIVHTRPMYARFVEMNSLFARELLQEGVLLYESSNP